MPPPLGHVHVWLIPTAGGWAMFDAGFPSPQGVDKLETEIQPLLTDGRRLEAVFISHYHPDHTAFAGRLQRAFDCDVYIHEADWERMQLMQRMREADDGSGDAFRHRFSSGWAESLDDHEFGGEQSQDGRGQHVLANARSNAGHRSAHACTPSAQRRRGHRHWRPTVRGDLDARPHRRPSLRPRP